jgi:hypothetical protein
MDSGESSSAATKLREELEASRKQVLELRSTLDQERKDARKTHEQFLAGEWVFMSGLPLYLSRTYFSFVHTYTHTSSNLSPTVD